MTRIYNTAGAHVPVYDTSGRLMFGDSGTDVPPARTPHPPSGPVANIVTGAEMASLGRSPVHRDGETMGTNVTARVDATSVVLTWVVARTYGPDAGGTYSATLTVAGKVYPVTVGGVTPWRVEVPTNETAVTYKSDPIPVNVLAGDDLLVTVTVDADGEAGGVSSTLTDGDGGSKWSWRPARIEATTNTPSWLCIGDSIVQQSNSYPGQACRLRGLPNVTAGVGGDAHLYFPGRWPWRAAPHIPQSTHMIDQFGINGHGGLPTAGLAFWNLAKANGIKYLVKTTISPTSKLGTQIARPGLLTDNAWLRDGAPVTTDKATALATGTTDPGAIRCDVVRPDGTIKKGTGGHPIDAVSDVAARIEDPANLGYLTAEAAAIIGDGDTLHPSPAVHALLGERLARDLKVIGF